MPHRRRLIRTVRLLVFVLLALTCVPSSDAAETLAAESTAASRRSDPAPLARLWNDQSPFNTRIPKDAVYTLEPRIGTVRNGFAGWSMPIYRVAASAMPEPVKILHRDSGRTAYWPIPPNAEPAAKDDAHLGVMVPSEGVIYEFWAAQWQPDGTLEAGGFNAFALNGTGISDPPRFRTTASGFAVSAGMVMREDVIDPATGKADNPITIDHALAIALHARLCGPGVVAPAVKPELKCEGDIPMGALFALPPDADIESLEIHPLAKAVARALRDYGAYVNDGRLGDDYQGKEVGAFRVEPGLLRELYGQGDNALAAIVAEDLFSVIERYGLYRVTAAKDHED